MSAVTSLRKTYSTSTDEVFCSGGRSDNSFVIKKNQPAISQIFTDPSLDSITSRSRVKPNIRVVSKPEYLRTANTVTRRFKSVQNWEGNVKQLKDDSFVAVIVDKTTKSNPSEEVEIDFDDVSPDDRSLLRAGACFYWSVGYEEAPGVPRQRVSRIRFRRLPGWSQRELIQAEKAAQSLADLF